MLDPVDHEPQQHHQHRVRTAAGERVATAVVTDLEQWVGQPIDGGVELPLIRRVDLRCCVERVKRAGQKMKHSDRLDHTAIAAGGCAGAVTEYDSGISLR